MDTFVLFPWICLGKTAIVINNGNEIISYLPQVRIFNELLFEAVDCEGLRGGEEL